MCSSPSLKAEMNPYDPEIIKNLAPSCPELAPVAKEQRGKVAF